MSKPSALSPVVFRSRNANHRLLSASNKQRCNRIVQQRLWSLRLAFANGSSNALPKMLLSVSFQGFGMHVFGTNICDNQRCRHSGSTWMCSAGSKLQQQSIAGNAPFPRTHSSVCWFARPCMVGMKRVDRAFSRRATGSPFADDLLFCYRRRKGNCDSRNSERQSYDQ